MACKVNLKKYLDTMTSKEIDGKPVTAEQALNMLPKGAVSQDAKEAIETNYWGTAETKTALDYGDYGTKVAVAAALVENRSQQELIDGGWATNADVQKAYSDKYPDRHTDLGALAKEPHYDPIKGISDSNYLDKRIQWGDAYAIEDMETIAAHGSIEAKENLADTLGRAGYTIYGSSGKKITNYTWGATLNRELNAYWEDPKNWRKTEPGEKFKESGDGNGVVYTDPLGNEHTKQVIIGNDLVLPNGQRLKGGAAVDKSPDDYHTATWIPIDIISYARTWLTRTDKDAATNELAKLIKEKGVEGSGLYTCKGTGCGRSAEGESEGGGGGGGSGPGDQSYKKAPAETIYAFLRVNSDTADADVIATSITTKTPYGGRVNENIRLKADDYEVLVSKPGYVSQTRLVKLTQYNATVTINLVKEKETTPTTPKTPEAGGGVTTGVKINAGGIGATVYIDGTLMGTTDSNIALDPGSYTATVKKAGYYDQDVNVNVIPNVIQTVTVTMTPTGQGTGTATLTGNKQVTTYIVPGKMTWFGYEVRNDSGENWRGYLGILLKDGAGNSYQYPGDPAYTYTVKPGVTRYMYARFTVPNNLVKGSITSEPMLIKVG